MACSLGRSNGLELCSLAQCWAGPVGNAAPQPSRAGRTAPICSPTTSWALSTGWDSEATAPQALVDIEFDLTVTGVCLAEVDLTLDRAGDAAPATLDRSADASPTMDGRLHGDLSAATLTDGPAYRIVWTCQPRCEPPPLPAARVVILIVATLTLLFGLAVGPHAATYAGSGDEPMMAGCGHAPVSMTSAALSRPRDGGGHHQPGRCATLADCCVGFFCSLNGVLPEAAVVPAPSPTTAVRFAAPTGDLQGVSVSPPFDPPRRSG